MRVTDLDEFTTTHIVSPYKLMMPPTVTIKNPDDAYRALSDYRDTTWAQYVIYRLYLIGVTFPRYITDPLVTLIEHEVALYHERNRVAMKQKGLRPSLADLSALKQHECIGMWVEYLPGNLEEGDFKIGVLAYHNRAREEAVVIRPDRGCEKYWAESKRVYPMYDLPRAWTHIGQPASHPDALLGLASNEDVENEREEKDDE